MLTRVFVWERLDLVAARLGGRSEPNNVRLPLFGRARRWSGAFARLARPPDYTHFSDLPHGDLPVPFITAEVARSLYSELSKEKRDANERHERDSRAARVNTVYNSLTRIFVGLLLVRLRPDGRPMNAWS